MEMTGLLGYTPEMLLGENVNKLMPWIIGKNHSAYIKRYFETAKSEVIEKERQLFAMDKEGYLVPIILLVKTIPHLKRGLTFIGMIKLNEKFNEI
jgi:PAS domain S-box-containing protein